MGIELLLENFSQKQYLINFFYKMYRVLNQQQFFFAQKQKRRYMRPTKNIVYCCVCQKPKMLFETKQKADNFIKYNSKEILEENGKAPIRSYHCMMCGGFHLTSNPSLLSAKRFEKRDMKRLEEISSHKHNNEIDEVNTIIRTFYERIQKIRQELYFGISEESKKLIELCRMDLKQLTELPVRNREKLIPLNTAMEKTENLYHLVETVLNLPEEEQQSYLNIKDPSEEQYMLKHIIRNTNSFKRVKTILSHHDEMLSNNEINITEGFKECEEILSTIIGQGRKKKIAYYNNWMNEQKKRIKEIRLSTESDYLQNFFSEYVDL